MLRTLDRYIIRQTLMPFGISLVVLTFVLELPPIINQAERLVARGTSWDIVAKVLITLAPQALGITIPMAFLVGLLIAFGRLSADRETVALQACGISLFRLLVPVAFLSAVATAATLYIMIVAVPEANQAFREIAFNVVSTHAESEIRPRVFYEDFPNIVLYVREVDTGGWTDVFVADTSKPDEPVVYLARRGRVLVDRTKRTVHIALQDGTSHNASMTRPEKYELTRFQTLILNVNPDTIFPRGGVLKGDPEMTIAELKARIREMEKTGDRTHNQVIAIQQKFSIPIACVVFGMIGLAVGVSNRKEGKLASFVLAIGVIFVYYTIMYMGRSMAKGAMIPAWSAMWLPNIILGAAGVILLWRRGRLVERPIRIQVPGFIQRWTASTTETPDAGPRSAEAGRTGVVVVIRVPSLRLPRLSLIDGYVIRIAARVVVLAAGGLLALFYISSFIDLSERLFKGTATGRSILEFLWFMTPQFIYYIIPMAVLLGALVTIGSLTKNSELLVMKACGISLYRVAAPLILLAMIGSATLFLLEERVLAYSNRRAEELNQVLRDRAPRTMDVLNRKWIVAKSGSIYHYLYFDTRQNELNGFSIYEFAHADNDALARRQYFRKAEYIPGGDGKHWRGIDGWTYEFQPGPNAVSRYSPIRQEQLTLEGPDYFVTEQPDADRMSYTQLRQYVTELQASGFNVTPYSVALQRKVAFPFVTLIMTLIAIPFAVTTGSRGAMYGIGAGILFAIVYWIAISAFAALGSGGLMPTTLAAWAPNLIFGAAAGYLILTVRT